MCNNNVKAIMKKIYSFLFAATALFAAVSCQKEVAPEVEAPKGEKITFTASTEVETKTALHENGKSTIWVAGDQISVFDANKEGNNRCFAIDELSEDAKTATFSYEGEFVKDQSGMADPTVVALYPYQENAYCDFFYYDRNYITGINFPAEQTAVAGSFDSKAAFALGLGTMNKKELGFQNLYALLKFTVRDAGVKKVTVKVNEGAYIAGDAKIQMVLNTDLIGNEEGKPVFESPVLSIVENGSNTITLTCENGFDTEATYYVAVVPTEFTSISLYCDDVLVNHKDATMTLVANKIYNLKDNGSPKKERGLAFAEEAYTATIGNKFTAPELKGETEGVEYSSSDESIASVNPETGVVTLNKAGSVTITAKAEESRYYLAGEASYTLTIKEKQDRALSYSPSTVTVTLNTEYTLPTLSGILKDVRYSSSNTTVADVDASGNVTVKAAGETTITAIADETDEYKADKVSYKLTVVEKAVIRIDNKNGWNDLEITIKQGVTTLASQKAMINEGNNIFAYSLDPQYVGKEVTYYIEHSWYQTSTKTTTLKADSKATAITLNTTYLEPGTWDWTSATFGAWMWGTGVSDIMVTGVKVKDNFFEFEIPADGYKNVIFVRCNKNNTTASWDTKWNQTADLTLYHKCFCVNAWDNAGNSQWY